MNCSFAIAASAVLAPGETPDVSFVEPMVRRRLSPLQKIYFALANKVGGAPLSAVFASRDGEDSLTRRIVDDFHEDGSVSPHRFSASVYNAAPGLWSVRTANRSPYTAIASGDDSIEAGLLEALWGARPTLYVYAEETGGGYGAAVLLVEKSGSESAFACEARPAAGDSDDGRLAFSDWTDLVSGRRESIRCRWISLSRVRSAD